MNGPCALVKVESWIVTQDFQVFYGSNDCETPIAKCPRTERDRVLQNYLACITRCHQKSHSEVRALDAALAAGANLKGARLFTSGNTICRTCQKELAHYGIVNFTLGRFPS